MLEAAVRNGLEKFRLQEEVAEAGGVNTDVRTLGLVGAARDCEITLLRITVGSASGTRRAGSAIGGLELLVGVIDQVFLARHGVGGGVLAARVREWWMARGCVASSRREDDGLGEKVG